MLEGSGLITHGGGSGFSLAVAVYTLENPLEWQGRKFCPAQVAALGACSAPPLQASVLSYSPVTV